MNYEFIGWTTLVDGCKDVQSALDVAGDWTTRLELPPITAMILVYESVAEGLRELGFESRRTDLGKVKQFSTWRGLVPYDFSRGSSGATGVQDFQRQDLEHGRDTVAAEGLSMAARKVAGPFRLETTGAAFLTEIAPRNGYGNVHDVVVMLKILKCSTLNTTAFTVGIKHSPDGDANAVANHSSPISAVTIAAEPALLVGNTDVATNGPLGEYVHYGVTIGGGAGEWAMVELWEVAKPN